MAGCKTDIDWASKPEPWCWIGPQFRREIDDLPPSVVAFGRKVRNAREMMGMSQAQLGRLAGYSVSGRDSCPKISAIETGAVNAVGERRRRLIEVLGIEE